jgi:hypothetical protein
MVGNAGWGGVDATQVADIMAGIIASHRHRWSAPSLRDLRWRPMHLWLTDAALF